MLQLILEFVSDLLIGSEVEEDPFRVVVRVTDFGKMLQIFHICGSHEIFCEEDSISISVGIPICIQ